VSVNESLPTLFTYVLPSSQVTDGPPMPGAPCTTAPEIDPIPVGPSYPTPATQM
jgi:hypothetical protein